MKTPAAFKAVALLAVCAMFTPPAAAGRVALRPLSPRELRRALVETGESPDGRSLSSALAGIKGFALGVSNGIGGALLYDVATSTQTIAYLTTLLNSLNSTLIGSSSSSSGSSATSQEVCFSSRSLNGQLSRSIDQDEDFDEQLDEDSAEELADDDEEDYEEPLGRQNDYLDYDFGAQGRGITCIVVNRGRAIVRHRRSIENPLIN